MDTSRDQEDLEEALRHARAGLKAVEAAHRSLVESSSVYPTHLHLSAVEFAHAIELAMRVAMRNS